MKIKAVSIGLLAAALAAMPITSASARDNYYRHGHGHGHGFGLIGAVVGGVAALAVAPFVILGDAVSGGGRRGRDYDQGNDDGYGSGYNRPPPSAYYANQREGYEGPPPGYYPPQQNYAPPQGYAPSQGYYPPPNQYGPPQQYAPPQQGGYQQQQQGYYPPPDGE